MKVTLYMAISVDGFIAKLNDETPWSDAENASYKSKVEEVGNLIIGKKTYDLSIEESLFADVGEPFVVVLTSSIEKPIREKTVFVKNFTESLEVLKRNGFKRALVAGGAMCNKAALESGLIDEIFIDVEPLVFGNGIPLFASSNTELKLKLLGFKNNGESGIQLHYKVIR